METMEAGRERPRDDLERVERGLSGSLAIEGDDDARRTSAVSLDETMDRSFKSAGPAKGEERRGLEVVLERSCGCEDRGNESELLGWGAKNGLK
jgi:hypothetical protein